MRYMGSRAKLSVRQRRTTLSAVGALCMALYFSASVAQTTTGDTAAADAATATAGLEEIVVTADEPVSWTTPISITAISGDELRAQGITSASQVGAEIPGISSLNWAPADQSEMRGISSASGTHPDRWVLSR